MVGHLRTRFNQRFSEDKYRDLLSYVHNAFNYTQQFRIAETPVFVSKELGNEIFEACHELASFIYHPDYAQYTQFAIPPGQDVPNESRHSLFLQLDFGLCYNEDKTRLIPQLIEAQGFPSLYFFQYLLAGAYREVYDIPDNYSSLFSGLDGQSYLDYLREIIVGDADPQNVILLEIEPEKQPTNIDFMAAEYYLGIRTVCISEVIKENNLLFYKNKDGKKIKIERIFNRVIFDELIQRDDISRQFSFRDALDVYWVGHPNWFFKISKYTLPLLTSRYVPPTFYLDRLHSYPPDLQNFVLKPLYTFSGTGVELDVNLDMLRSIKDPQNWILQRKVEYAPIIQTPDAPAKCEIRMLMVRDPKTQSLKIINNLARLSKGAMVGTRYNKNKQWVGGSVAFFET